ncbi:MAG: T9SS type A sorting domain-containing protein [Flavobacteriaceae bacterium]
MKKITILLIVLTGFITTSQSQTISLIGDAVGGWADINDVDMTTADNITYTLSDYIFVTGGVKFRQDHAWTNNWGGTDFPSGTGVFNSGSNIPVIGGTYNVTFNLNTLAFNFENVVTYQIIGIIGTAVNNGSTTDENMATTDGDAYFINNITLVDGNAHFRQDDAETVNWGATSFPSGTGAQNGGDIPVTAGTYNITFNRLTGDYSFDYLVVSIMGAFNSWSADVDLSTTDGENYMLNDFVLAADGELKFRQNHDWGTSWGGSGFPSGANEGTNISALAGTYDVTFNRLTTTYTFLDITLSTEDFSSASIDLFASADQVYINGLKSNENYTLSIFDTMGRQVKSITSNSDKVDISELHTAVYFLVLETAEGSIIRKKIIKQ